MFSVQMYLEDKRDSELMACRWHVRKVLAKMTGGGALKPWVPSLWCPPGETEWELIKTRPNPLRQKKTTVSLFLLPLQLLLNDGLKRPFPSVQFLPVACRLAGFCAARVVQFRAVTVWIIIQTLVGGKERTSFKKWNAKIAVKSFILKQS